jgi:hypothetical protein
MTAPAREGAQTKTARRARGPVMICRPSPADGNITTDHRGRTYVYDAENVLRAASGLASGTATYRYHADGSRREKTALGATTQFYYMGGLGYLDEEDTQFAAPPRRAGICPPFHEHFLCALIVCDC